MDVAGRVDRFRRKYANTPQPAAKPRSRRSEPHFDPGREARRCSARAARLSSFVLPSSFRLLRARLPRARVVSCQESARPYIGGQAVIEGVMMRSPGLDVHRVPPPQRRARRARAPRRSSKPRGSRNAALRPRRRHRGRVAAAGIARAALVGRALRGGPAPRKKRAKRPPPPRARACCRPAGAEHASLCDAADREQRPARRSPTRRQLGCSAVLPILFAVGALRRAAAGRRPRASTSSSSSASR